MNGTAMGVASSFDLRSRTAVVTGGDSGLGFEVARALVSADASVTLTAPDATHVRHALERLHRQFDGATVHAAHLDLRSMASVARFLEWFSGTGQPLHLLVNASHPAPAAIMRRTQDGFESVLAGTYLGHFALSMGLLGALRRSAGARVINLATSAHVLGDVDMGDLHFARRRYNAWVSYGQAQTANLLMTAGFAQHFHAEGIACHAVNPGEVSPSVLRTLSVQEVRGRGWTEVPGVLGPPPFNAAQAAAPVVLASLTAKLDGLSGTYCEHGQVASPWPTERDPASGDFQGYLPRAMDPARALQLWEISERLIRAAG